MSPTKASLFSLLQRSKSPSLFRQIHAQLITTALIADASISTQFFTSLVYLHPPNLVYLRSLFTQIHHLTTYLYNTMIRAHANCSNPVGALNCYLGLRRSGLSCDDYTFPLVLKAIGSMGGVVEGRQVHGEIVKGGFECNLFVVNGLVGMYGKCGELAIAKMVFDGFDAKDIVSWNLMLSCCIGCGQMEGARKVFDEMPHRVVISWSVMIDAYGKKSGDVARARALFDEMPLKDLITWNSMIAGYTKAGDLNAADRLFSLMPVKNVISWSIMLDGYASHGRPQKALRLFEQMLQESVNPDKVSVTGALSACAQLGALAQGRWIHMYMKKQKIEMDSVVKTALLDMYIKCGGLDEAQRMFHNMSEKNIISYSVMILGLGMNGYGKEALECFSEMVLQGIPMDDMVFLGVLTACSHSGLVFDGLQIFDQMRTVHGIEPKQEHYGCLVDLLARSGHLNQAREVIETMPMKPNSTLYGSLLLASWIHRDVGLAELAVDRLRELEADDGGAYTLLSNIYADAGMLKDSLRIREFTKIRNINKEIGKSVIEVDDSIQQFGSGEISGDGSEELIRIIRSISKIAPP